ncbi:Uncharacterised protein [Candidatus Gugararchaeum adminiculabundum]|nr:Uncharacterised protein [Candidatus Gugararchaeum adminiculabundum]
MVEIANRENMLASNQPNPCVIIKGSFAFNTVEFEALHNSGLAPFLDEMEKMPLSKVVQVSIEAVRLLNGGLKVSFFMEILAIALTIEPKHIDVVFAELTETSRNENPFVAKPPVTSFLISLLKSSDYGACYSSYVTEETLLELAKSAFAKLSVCNDMKKWMDFITEAKKNKESFTDKYYDSSAKLLTALAGKNENIDNFMIHESGRRFTATHPLHDLPSKLKEFSNRVFSAIRAEKSFKALFVQQDKKTLPTSLPPYAVRRPPLTL